MARQGDALTFLIKGELKLGQSTPRNARILDAACGIGTQTLPLAARGFRLVARDLSPKALARLEREADARGLKIDAAVADMRRVQESVSGEFDVVLVFDNSLAHLLSDDDLRMRFRNFSRYSALAGYSFAPFVIMTRFHAARPRAMCMVHDSMVGKDST
jgi:SAM-dependent methyltransferase